MYSKSPDPLLPRKGLAARDYHVLVLRAYRAEPSVSSTGDTAETRSSM